MSNDNNLADKIAARQREDEVAVQKRADEMARRIESASKQVFQASEALTLEQSKQLIQDLRHCLKCKPLLGEVQSDYLDLIAIVMQHAGMSKENVYKDMQGLRRKIIAWYDSVPECP
jgi:hypothetical protein